MILTTYLELRNIGADFSEQILHLADLVLIATVLFRRCLSRHVHVPVDLGCFVLLAR